MAARSKAWVYGRSLAEFAGSNPVRGVHVYRFVCCQEEISATGRSLVQRNSTECGVSECDQVTSQRGPRPTVGLSSHEKMN